MIFELIIGITAIVAAVIVSLLISVLLCSVLNVTGSFSTGSKKLGPEGALKGRALVAYDVGLSGAAKRMAANIANDLRAKGYEVMLAGVKSAAAADVSGYDVIVAGGPIYSSTASNSVKAYLKALKPKNGVKVGAFARGWAGNVFEDPFPGAIPLKSTLVDAKLSIDDGKRSSFIEKLLR
jgi:flavodoxin